MTLSEDASQLQQSSSQVSLATWQPLTEDSTFIVNPNSVQMVFDPIADLRSMYMELVNGN